MEERKSFPSSVFLFSASDPMPVSDFGRRGVEDLAAAGADIVTRGRSIAASLVMRK